MNDRDFKLLVREYFQAKSKVLFNPTYNLEPLKERRDALEQQVLLELQRFTEKEQQELPFKD